MSINRLCNISIAAVLVIVVALTIWQSAETTKIVSAAPQQNSLFDTGYCFSGMDRLSLEGAYVEGAGWVSYTDQGPTGVNGGLLELLSKSQSCSIGKEN